VGLGLAKSFSGRRVVDHVDLSAAPGEVLGLVGPNGAGKSTLLSLLDGSVRCDAGQVMVAGVEVTSSSPARRARLGIGRTFQQVALFAGLTVTEHLHLVRRSTHRFTIANDLLGRQGPNDADRAWAGAILERFGLTGVADRAVETLPLGTSRVVELARAVATGPSVLLLDEPSSGLDDEGVALMAEVITDMTRSDGVAVVLVEHDRELVRSVCDRVLVLSAGAELASGPALAVLEDPDVVRHWAGGR